MENGDNVLVAHRGRRSPLALEAGPVRTRRRELWAQNLESHDSVEALVISLEDHAEGAPAQLFLEVIIRQLAQRTAGCWQARKRDPSRLDLGPHDNGGLRGRTVAEISEDVGKRSRGRRLSPAQTLNDLVGLLAQPLERVPAGGTGFDVVG
jgi:hypothetical protein